MGSNRLVRSTSRKQVMLICLVFTALLIGIVGAIDELWSKAATSTASLEAEAGITSGTASIINDTTASSTKALKFGSEPTTASKRLLGIYNSDGGDAQTNSLMGQYPEIASTYYQSNQQTLNIGTETTRISHGTSPMITITTRGSTHLAGIAAGNAASLAWLDAYVAALNTLSNVNNNVKVYATLDHEWEVKVNQSTLTGEAADPVVYAKALSIFYQKCKANAQKVIYTYWVGGSDTTAISEVMTELVSNGTPPELISADPYVNGTGVQTAAANWADTLDKFRTGALKSSYVSLSDMAGQGASYRLPLAITEHGIQTDTHTADQVASYFTNLRQQMATQDIVFSIFFNSDNTKPHMITPGGSNAVPAAVTNLATSFAQPPV